MARDMRGVLRERDRGFTLIELLVVVIIIGILAAVAVPVYLNQRKKAYKASLRADVNHVVAAYKAWEVDRAGQMYPNMQINWGAGDNITNASVMSTLGISNLSPATRVHSFDLADAYPGNGWVAGQHFCIEIGSTAIGAGNITYYWNSAKGGYTTTSCAASVP